MSQIFRDDAAMEDFRWGNAARYLGLGVGDRTRARLASFLGVNAGLLSSLTQEPDAHDPTDRVAIDADRDQGGCNA
jgi:hypothetical protein